MSHYFHIALQNHILKHQLQSEATVLKSHHLYLFIIGENPRGVWQLKITDNNNMEQNDLLSQEETDVEDLEEKVIDEKTKANKNTWKIMREKVSVVT